MMATIRVHVPRIEDEIEQCWQAWRDSPEGWSNGIDMDCGPHGSERREVFEAGFRAARTFVKPEV